MKTLTCIVVDDEKAVLDRFEKLITYFDDIELISKNSHPEVAVEQIIHLQPDLVFIDVEMPRMTGFDVIKEVRARNVNPVFIFVTGYSTYAIKAIRNAAFDFLVKPIDLEELKESLERYRKKILGNTSPPTNQYVEHLNLLTERERIILKCIGELKTSDQIAEELFISKYTVDTHRKNILRKLNLHKTSELVLFAKQCGLV